MPALNFFICYNLGDLSFAFLKSRLEKNGPTLRSASPPYNILVKGCITKATL